MPIPCDQIPDWLAELFPVAKPFLPPPTTPPAPSVAPGWPASLSASGKPAPARSAAPAIAAPISQPQPPPDSATKSAPPSIKQTSLRAPKALTRLAEQAIQETGFDPRTGQIVNPTQFQQWKQQKAHPGDSTGAPTNASIMEVFRKGRTAVENWVDDDRHRALVLEGDIGAIQRDPELQAILTESGKYGPTMVAKLLAHLAFLIDNRRKYHAALNARVGNR